MKQKMQKKKPMKSSVDGVLDTLEQNMGKFVVFKTYTDETIRGYIKDICIGTGYDTVELQSVTVASVSSSRDYGKLLIDCSTIKEVCLDSVLLCCDQCGKPMSVVPVSKDVVLDGFLTCNSCIEAHPDAKVRYFFIDEDDEDVDEDV